MGQRLGVVYTIVTVIFFAILAVIFVLRVNATRDDNISRASSTLQLIRQTAQTALSDPAISPSRLRGALHGIIQNDPSIELVSVYSYSGGTEYLWARNPGYLPENQRDIAHTVGIPQFQYSNLNSVKVTDSFDAPDGVTYFVATIITVIGNSDIYPLIRDSLVLILLYALVTLLITVLLMVTRKRTVPDAFSENEQSPIAGPAPETPFRAIAPPAIELEREEPVSTVPRQYPELQEAVAEPQPVSPVSTDSISRDGVISPHTGLSYRDHLDRRLTLELERAAFNDQDLSVAHIRFPGIRGRSELYANAARLVLDHFAFEDLAFEFDDETFFVILPNSELNVGIKSAEAFQRKSAAFVRQHSLATPRIGLSSRNGRLTEGPQMLKEARQALNRANQDSSSRIVGFHPDPQRYRAFVAGKDGSPD